MSALWRLAHRLMWLPTALQSFFSFCNSSVFMCGGWDYCPVRQLHSCYQAMIQQTDDSLWYWCQNGCFCLYFKHNNWVFCGSWHFLVFKFFLWKFLTEGVRCPMSHNKYYIAAVFWVICLWVQGGTVHTLKGKHPAIISTTSLDSNLSFLRQMRPLEQMDSYLIVLLWLYFSAFNDSCVYSFVELPPLLFFYLRSTWNSLFFPWLVALPLFLFFSLRYESWARINSLLQGHFSLASSKDLK